MANQIERREWKTLNKMNAPVYLAGLVPWQWVVVVVFAFVVLFLLLTGESPFRFFLLLIPVGVYMAIKKVAKENDAGNPDYINSLTVWLQLPKHLLDSTNVFQKLKQKSERAGTKI